MGLKVSVTKEAGRWNHNRYVLAIIDSKTKLDKTQFNKKLNEIQKYSNYAYFK